MSYEPLVEFPNGTVDFVLGFEAGRLWQQLKALENGETMEQEFHAANAEIVLRMCERLEIEHRAEIADETWMLGHFEATDADWRTP